MKKSKKLGIQAFYLLYVLIILFVLTEIIKGCFDLQISLDSWRLAFGNALALLGIVWGGVATKNFRRNKDSKE